MNLEMSAASLVEILPVERVPFLRQSKSRYANTKCLIKETTRIYIAKALVGGLIENILYENKKLHQVIYKQSPHLVKVRGESHRLLAGKASQIQRQVGTLCPEIQPAEGRHSCDLSLHPTLQSQRMRSDKM